MSDPTKDVLDRVAAIGGRLRVVDGALEYVGPTTPLDDDLRVAIRKHKDALIEAVRPRRVSEMVAYLCDRGVLLTVTDGVLGLELGAEPRLDDVDLDVLDELSDRHVEVVEWLRRPAAEMSSEELRDLGFAPHFKQRPADTVPLTDDNEADGRLSPEVLDDVHDPASFQRGVRAIDQWFAAIERDERESAQATSHRQADDRERDRGAEQEELW